MAVLWRGIKARSPVGPVSMVRRNAGRIGIDASSRHSRNRSPLLSNRRLAALRRRRSCLNVRMSLLPRPLARDRTLEAFGRSVRSELGKGGLRSAESSAFFVLTAPRFPGMTSSDSGARSRTSAQTAPASSATVPSVSVLCCCGSRTRTPTTASLSSTPRRDRCSSAMRASTIGRRSPPRSTSPTRPSPSCRTANLLSRPSGPGDRMAWSDCSATSSSPFGMRGREP